MWGVATAGEEDGAGAGAGGAEGGYEAEEEEVAR